MSRGPTRRVRRLLRTGAVSGELLQGAEREADLLAHPYVDVHHLELARLRLAGLEQQRQEMLAQLVVGIPPRRWRPRGPRSALRRNGLAETRSAYLRARAQEEGRGEQQT